jgi:hypothetical protein
MREHLQRVNLPQCRSTLKTPSALRWPLRATFALNKQEAVLEQTSIVSFQCSASIPLPRPF